MSVTSKIVLGTVQFGINYGINNTSGQISPEEAFRVLAYAWDHRIMTLDTAHTYGNSEQVIGKFIKENGKPFDLISKVPKIEEGKKVVDYLRESLNNLNATQLFAYLFHDFNSFKSDPGLLRQLLELKKNSMIQKVGFSLYYPHELDYLLNNKIDFDIVQIPYNIFDQRFEKYFAELKALGKEVHVRSVFLQGLVFKNPNKLESKFASIKDKLVELNRISDESGIKVSGLCLNFAVLNKNIDKVVIGVDSLKNLEENISDLLQSDRVLKYYQELKTLREDDEQIILPTNWK